MTVKIDGKVRAEIIFEISASVGMMSGNQFLLYYGLKIDLYQSVP